MDFDTYLEQDITIRVNSNPVLQHGVNNIVDQAVFQPIPNFDKNKSYPNWPQLVMPSYVEDLAFIAEAMSIASYSDRIDSDCDLPF